MAEYVFNEEQQALRSAVRKFCAENFGEDTVRRLMESEPRFDRAVWRRLGSELGVLLVHPLHALEYEAYRLRLASLDRLRRGRRERVRHVVG